MLDFERLYFELFNAVSDAIEQLQAAQQRCEERYVGDAEGERAPAHPPGLPE